MYPKELIQKIHQSLPPELVEPIASETTLATIEAVATKNDFSTEQMQKLEKVLSFRLMGLVTQEKFADNIQKELGITSDVAKEVAGDLNKEVLGGISPEILQQQEENAKKELTASQVIHNTLPAIEEGEKVHEVPHDTKLDVMPKPTPAPASTPVPSPVVAPAPVTPAPTPVAPVTQPQNNASPELSTSAPVPRPTNEKLRPHSDTPIKKDAPKTPDYRYPGGADPYREPLA